MVMKLYFSIVLLFSIIIFSCRDAIKENNKQTQIPITTTPTKVCYLWSMNTDTVKLSLATKGDSISGSLDYLPFEKDSRIGKLNRGQWHGDTLFIQYISTQEGQDSECEFAILKSGNCLLLTSDIWEETNYRYNERYTQGFFIDKSKIKFSTDSLKNIDCK